MIYTRVSLFRSARRWAINSVRQQQSFDALGLELEMKMFKSALTTLKQSAMMEWNK